jgi:hypothetical protein
MQALSLAASSMRVVSRRAASCAALRQHACAITARTLLRRRVRGCPPQCRTPADAVVRPADTDIPRVKRGSVLHPRAMRQRRRSRSRVVAPRAKHADIIAVSPRCQRIRRRRRRARVLRHAAPLCGSALYRSSAAAATGVEAGGGRVHCGRRARLTRLVGPVTAAAGCSCVAAVRLPAGAIIIFIARRQPPLRKNRPPPAVQVRHIYAALAAMQPKPQGSQGQRVAARASSGTSSCTSPLPPAG